MHEHSAVLFQAMELDREAAAMWKKEKDLVEAANAARAHTRWLRERREASLAQLLAGGVLVIDLTDEGASSA